MPLVPTEEYRARIDEEFALTKIVSVEVEDDIVTIHSRLDTGAGLGFYKLTVRPFGDGRLAVATEFTRGPGT